MHYTALGCAEIGLALGSVIIGFAVPFFEAGGVNDAAWVWLVLTWLFDTIPFVHAAGIWVFGGHWVSPGWVSLPLLALEGSCILRYLTVSAARRLIRRRAFIYIQKEKAIVAFR